MAYNEKLAERIRERLNEIPINTGTKVKETKLMGGLAFMVDDKMCVGVFKDEMLCRIDPASREELLERQGAHVMDFTGRPMKGFVLVEYAGMKSTRDFEFWIAHCLEYNKVAKRAKKKAKTKKG
jgi:TfoX/Sxy family transcriptional regulator of competence genes